MRMVSWFGVGVLAVVVAAGSGCVGADDAVGRVDLALAAQTPSGTLYRLRDATLSVEGPAAQLLFHTEDDPTRTVIHASTPAGAYALTLRDGWHLERVAADGTTLTVNAALVSANPQPFEVASGVATQVKLRFSVDGGQVQTGDGALDIGIEVDEPADGGVIDAPPIDAPPADLCADPLPCPAPSAGKSSVCGRILQIGDSLPFVPPAGSQVQLAFYDSLAYINDPAGTQPLLGATPDACGRFALTDVPVPPTSFVSLAVVGSTPTDPLAPTAVALALTAGGRAQDVHAYTSTAFLAERWGDVFVPPISLPQRGVYLAIFLDRNAPPVGPFAGRPVAGVRITSDGIVDTSRDVYFADESPLGRVLTALSGTTATGVDGSALFFAGQLVEYSGVGPTGCTFPSMLGATVPGLIVVQELLGSCN